MDINSLGDKSVLENVDGLQGFLSSANRDHCPPSSLADDLINDLANAVAEAFSLGVGEESLNIEDGGRESVDIKDVAEVEQTSNGDRISSVEHRDAYKGPQQVKVTRKSLNKCATFPNPNGVPTPDTSSNLEEEEPQTALCSQSGEEHCHQAYSRSLSLPAPSKLLSALKGSREKVGLSPGKLSVTWAPDVYDPPATSMSHTVTGKKQQKSKNKKYWKRDGKKGQKSSSSRGKEKKQYRRSGASERSHRSLDIRETLVDTNNDFGELMVGSPDQHSYCGSSFMKNSLSQMHYPVAEATRLQKPCEQHMLRMSHRQLCT